MHIKLASNIVCLAFTLSCLAMNQKEQGYPSDKKLFKNCQIELTKVEEKIAKINHLLFERRDTELCLAAAEAYTNVMHRIKSVVLSWMTKYSYALYRHENLVPLLTSVLDAYEQIHKNKIKVFERYLKNTIKIQKYFLIDLATEQSFQECVDLLLGKQCMSDEELMEILESYKDITPTLELKIALANNDSSSVCLWKDRRVLYSFPWGNKRPSVSRFSVHPWFSRMRLFEETILNY
jgi:hypothetical protein